MLFFFLFVDDVKLQLAKDNVCETIYGLVETYKALASTSEARALMKLACDLIVLILTGGKKESMIHAVRMKYMQQIVKFYHYALSDESMHYLYSTPLLKNMEDWLDSYDVDLLTTGVLALGNFARTDSHCIEMVQRNITKKLLGKFAKY